MKQSITQLGIFSDSVVIRQPPKRIDKRRATVGRILHLGAGVQSSCIAEMIIEHELPPVDLVLFADTKNEPPWVYAQINYLRERLQSINIPLVIVEHSRLGLVGDCYANIDKRFVSMPLYTKDNAGNRGQIQRQCTAEYKIKPCDNYQLKWLVETLHQGKLIQISKGSQKGSIRRIANTNIQIENIYGISWDEWTRAGKRGPHWQKAIYPLIDKRMTRADCSKWLSDHGLPIPLKSSCIICPYHSNQFWHWLATDHQSIFESACVFDNWIRLPDTKKRLKAMRQDCYLHSSCIPLESIDFDSQLKLDLPDYLCGDHCHT